ncbi:MAG: metallophosphoesterase [Lentisphaeria bacterium]|jgi:Icc-related predicted phosphoesterase|nr:metallophosphoesterase [Lentisphaeria bacterium]
MILFLSDVHSRYEVVDRQVAHAEQEIGEPVADVLILGDFGLFEPFLKRFFRRQGQHFLRPTHFIEGNHEDFDHFERLVERYRDVIDYLPRGTVHQISGTSTLALGGVCYMDSHTTPRRAEIREADIARCLAHPKGSVDVVLSHDCPAGIGVLNQSGFEHYGPPGFVGAERILDHFHPRLWVFGHHHRWFDRTLDGTRFFGLPQSWLGCAALTADGELHRIEHVLPEKPRPAFPLWRWFGKGKGQPPAL